MKTTLPIRTTKRPAITENCVSLRLQTGCSRSVVYGQRIDRIVSGVCACGDRPVLMSSLEWKGTRYDAYCLICPICGGEWERQRTGASTTEVERLTH